jgi:hypothetical protein
MVIIDYYNQTRSLNMNVFSFFKQVHLVHQVKHSLIKINSDSFINGFHIRNFKQGQQGQLVPLGRKVDDI